MKMRSLSLDPSVHNVGWSLVNPGKSTREKAWRWGTFKLEGNSLEMKLIHLRDQIIETVGEFEFLITEKPAFFSSERGQIAAHMNYTINLAAVNYYIAGWFHMDHRHHFAITANQWKGSVPKAVTARRFLRYFEHFSKAKLASIDEHGIDAVMLHYFWLHTTAAYLPYYSLDLDAIKARLI